MSARQSAAVKISPAMIRELRAIEFDGNPSDPYDWQHAPESLWFHARDKVLGALLRRGLIVDDGGYKLTDDGKAVLKEQPNVR
jgi:hypothetical protein